MVAHAHDMGVMCVAKVTGTTKKDTDEPFMAKFRKIVGGTSGVDLRKLLTEGLGEPDEEGEEDPLRVDAHTHTHIVNTCVLHAHQVSTHAQVAVRDNLSSSHPHTH